MEDITLDKLAEMVQKGFAETHERIGGVEEKLRDVESHLLASINALDVPRIRVHMEDHEERLLRVERKLGIRE